MADEMTRAMFGQNAIHVPCWMKVYEAGNGVAFVGASKTPDLMYGAKERFVLTIGEIIVRPHVAIGSNHPTGYGAAGLLTECDLDAWVEGTYLVNPMGMEIRRDGKLVKR